MNMKKLCECKNTKTGAKKYNGNTKAASHKIMYSTSMNSTIQNHSWKNVRKVYCVRRVYNSTDCRLVA